MFKGGTEDFARESDVLPPRFDAFPGQESRYHSVTQKSDRFHYVTSTTGIGNQELKDKF